MRNADRVIFVYLHNPCQYFLFGLVNAAKNSAWSNIKIIANYSLTELVALRETHCVRYPDCFHVFIGNEKSFAFIYHSDFYYYSYNEVKIGFIDELKIKLKIKSKKKHKEKIKVDGLSCKELRVIQLISRGFTLNEIGIFLDVNLKTVGGYCCSAMKKLGVSNRIYLFKLMIENNILI